MKRILFLTHIFPYPPNDGGKIVSFNTIKELIDFGHKVSICSFISSEESADFPLSVENIKTITIDYKNSVGTALKSVLSSKPFNMEKYISKEMELAIKELLTNGNFDIVYTDHLHMAYYSNLIRTINPQIKLYLRQHNVESQIMKRTSENHKNLLLKAYLYQQYLKLNQYEKTIVNNFDEIFMITNEDLSLLKNMNNKVKLSYLPAGVDTNKYAPQKGKMFNDKTIVFLGTMSWLPNVHGIKWFIEEIFDDIVERYPKVKLLVVGKNPPDDIKNKSNYPDNITVTGFVDDERPYIATADVFIVPLKIGGGMRIKILNALSMKKAIVSTTIGAEGINLPSNSIVIADNNEEFRKGVVKCLDDGGFTEQISQNGYDYILEKFSNKSILAQHAKHLDTQSG